MRLKEGSMVWQNKTKNREEALLHFTVVSDAKL